MAQLFFGDESASQPGPTSRKLQARFSNGYKFIKGSTTNLVDGPTEEIAKHSDDH